MYYQAIKHIGNANEILINRHKCLYYATLLQLVPKMNGKLYTSNRSILSLINGTAGVMTLTQNLAK